MTTSSGKPINLAAVLAHGKVRGKKREPASKLAHKFNPLDPDERNYNNWFKLQHSFIQTLNHPELQYLGNAKCSNPQCVAPNKTRGAIATPIPNVSMCRECFIVGYGIPSKDQLTLDELQPEV